MQRHYAESDWCAKTVHPALAASTLPLRRHAARHAGNGRSIVLGRPPQTPMAGWHRRRRLPARHGSRSIAGDWCLEIHRAKCGGSAHPDGFAGRPHVARCSAIDRRAIRGRRSRIPGVLPSTPDSHRARQRRRRTAQCLRQERIFLGCVPATARGRCRLAQS